MTCVRIALPPPQPRKPSFGAAYRTGKFDSCSSVTAGDHIDSITTAPDCMNCTDWLKSDQNALK